MNIGKTVVAGVVWADFGPRDIGSTGWRPRLYAFTRIFGRGGLVPIPQASHGWAAEHLGPEDGAEDSVKVVPFRKGVRYLGVDWSPGFDRDDASASVRRVVDRFLGCLSSVPVSAASTAYLSDNVLWAQLAYRLRFERVSEAGLDSAEAAVRGLLAFRARLSTRASLLVQRGSSELGTFGYVRWWDRVMSDRLMWVYRALDRGHAASALLESAMARLQRRFARASPVLESPDAAGGKWLWAPSAHDGGFLGALSVWCGSNGISLRGSLPRLPTVQSVVRG